MARLCSVQKDTVIASKEDPLLTVGYDCIQNTFLNTCHDMGSVCNIIKPYKSYKPYKF